MFFNIIIILPIQSLKIIIFKKRFNSLRNTCIIQIIFHLVSFVLRMLDVSIAFSGFSKIVGATA